ncbi:hypothetical protein AA313_de0209166 [Arthrobotrys entomopaga]|nr:hypothetical protein AA313_de0209166 [Arthrobotrys entomopaga]
MARTFHPYDSGLCSEELESLRKEWPPDSIAIGTRLKTSCPESAHIVLCQTGAGRAVIVKIGGLNPAKEANFLSMLKRHGFAYSPSIYGFYYIIDYNVVVMEMMPGTSLSARNWGNLGDLGRENFKRQFVHVMSRFRDTRCDCAPGINDCGSHQYHSEQEFANPILASLERVDTDNWVGITSEDKDYGMSLVRNYLNDSARKPVKFVPTHGRLRPQNILVDTDGNITSLIDFSRSGFLPEYCELGFVFDIAPWDRWWDKVLVETLEAVSPDYGRNHPMVLFLRTEKQIANNHSPYAWTHDPRFLGGMEDWLEKRNRLLVPRSMKSVCTLS